MKPIGTQTKEDQGFLKRADYQKELLRKLIAEKEKIKLGGGLKAIEKQKEKGKLPARERINLDNSSGYSGQVIVLLINPPVSLIIERGRWTGGFVR